MKRYVPWWGKIIAKLILSRLPVSYRKWAGLDLFKHGGMNDPSYVVDTFFSHFDAVYKKPEDANGHVFLEIGPGDSIASALCSHAVGVGKTYLVDVGDFAEKDTALYQSVAQELSQKIDNKFDLPPEFKDMCSVINVEYLTDGLTSYRDIPDNTVDFIFSNAALEHVRVGEFEKTMVETYRILKSGAYVSHQIDYRDHLGGGLNNLRFSSKLWEKDWMANSGFYTNRMQAQDMIEIFKKVGFEIIDIKTKSWDELSTPKAKMALEFQNVPDDHLKVYDMRIILRKPVS